MKIRTRVLASAALAVAAALFCSALLWIGATRSISADTEQAQVQTTSRLIAGLIRLTNEYTLHSEPRAAEQWRRQYQVLADTLAAPVQSGETSAARGALRTSMAELPLLFGHLTELTAAPGDPLTQRRRDLLVDQLLARTQVLADATYRWSREAAGVEQAARRWLRLGGAGGLLVLLAATLAQPIIVWRRVLRPLRALENAAAAVERGDLTARCASTANDELGVVTRGFDAMAVALAARNAELHRSEKRLRAIADNMPALITQLDVHERYTFVNAYVERMLGVRPDAMTGTLVREFAGSRLYAEIAPHIRATLQGRQTDFEVQLVVSGALRHYQTTYIPDRDDDGAVRGLYGISFDVTERKRSEIQQAASERRLRTITDNLPVLIAYIDSEHRYQYCNATYEKWFGIPAAQLEGQRVVDSVGEQVYEQRRPFIERALAGERVESEQLVVLPGGARFLNALYVPHQEKGVTLGMYALVTDMTDIRLNEAQLIRLARFDSLTGLPNRRQFDERLDEAMARSRRLGHPIALLFLDLDNFKTINDLGGHAAGDAVLQEFARRLQNTVRVTDTVARLAGDEFVIILESLHAPAEAEKVARKLVLAVRDDFLIDGAMQKVTTSVGVALFENDATTPTELIARADAALYEAKAAGRDGYCVAQSGKPCAQRV